VETSNVAPTARQQPSPELQAELREILMIPPDAFHPWNPLRPGYDSRPRTAQRGFTRPMAIGLAIWGVGFAAAFALSWKTNSNWNRGLFAKLSYGLGAGAHSWSYMLLWVMYIWGRHNPAAFVARLAVDPPIVDMS